MAVSSDEDENHWPGYVDALTTMTMMLIFIMTILAVTIFGLSQNISRSFVERIARAANVDVSSLGGSGTQELAERVASAIEQRPQTAVAAATPAEAPPASEEAANDAPAPAEPAKTFRSAAVAPADAPGTVTVERDEALLTLVFSQRATGVDQATADEMKAFIAAADRADGSGLLEIKAYAARDGAISDARRVAFYRLMTVRQQLIAMGVQVHRIKVRIEDRDRPADGDVLQIFARRTG